MPVPIDVHAHYVPRRIIDVLAERAANYDISLVGTPSNGSCALHFHYGMQVRPFFPKLIEDIDRRIDAMTQQGVDRQILSLWADIFGYGMEPEAAFRWHRLLNETLASVVHERPDRFSMLASVPLPNAPAAAAELAYAVRELGAIGAVVGANVEGMNLGELPLDEFWAAAEELDVPVFIHPVQSTPAPRAANFALSQIAQYTFDTTLCVGSLMFSGVLDRFPGLRVLLSHGGGAFPYLMGRFDCMHERMDRAAQHDVAVHAPSSYARRFYYDTILHDAATLRWLADRVSVERVVLGSDYSFPPEDRDPVASVRGANFSEAERRLICDDNARILFPRLLAATP